jgi:hypothetical protein
MPSLLGSFRNIAKASPFASMPRPFAAPVTNPLSTSVHKISLQSHIKPRNNPQHRYLLM